MTKQRLSDSLIRSLPITPHTQGPRHMDAMTHGFYIRHTATGHWNFYLRYRSKEGKNREVAIGRWNDTPARGAGEFNTAEAREQASTIAAAINLQRFDPVEAKKQIRSSPTLRDFVGEPDPKHYPGKSFWDIRKAQVADWRYQERNFQKHFGHWGRLKLTDINKTLLEAWINEHLLSPANPEGRQWRTLQLIMNPLSILLNMAVDRELIPYNPYLRIKKPKVDTSPEPKYATDEQIEKLRRALRQRDTDVRRKNPDQKFPVFVDFLEPWILVAINTGMRPIEIFRLRWAAVNFKDARLTVRGITREGRGTKSGRTRSIRLPDEALIALKDWHNQSSRCGVNDPVFPSTAIGFEGQPMTKMPSCFTRLVKTYGLDGFNLYSLRHAYATKAIQFADQKTVADMMGHASINITNRYLHSRGDDHVVEILEKMFPPKEIRRVK